MERHVTICSFMTHLLHQEKEYKS